MHRTVRPRRGWLFAAALLGLAPQALGGGARIVRPGEDLRFLDLQQAIDAAVDGDVILVGAGDYRLTFTLATVIAIGDKSISLMAEPDLGGHLQFGTIQVTGLSAGKTVVISGFRIWGPPHQVPRGRPGMLLANNAGHVRVQDCLIEGGLGGETGTFDKAEGGHGVEVVDCDDVAFVRCTLLGERGFGSGLACVQCDAGHGGNAIDATRSRIALYDCALTGGTGGGAGRAGGDGGHGVHLREGELFASGSSIAGAHAGNASAGPPAFGGDGGDGLHVETGSIARVLDVALSGGNAGHASCCPGNSGQPGAPTGGGGQVVVLSGSARSIAAETVASDARGVALTATGEPGDRVFLAPSAGFGHRFHGAVRGTWLVPFPARMAFPELGTIPSSGVLDVRLDLPDLAGDIHRRLNLQGYVIDAVGNAFLATALVLEVLGEGAAPDCDGNGVFDLVDTFVLGAPDCDDNLVPDPCDPDCNGNGAVDGCDILEGSSQDINRNGIPDECEVPTTLYVDASAPPGGDGSAARPFRSIGRGIQGSLAGWTVLVADGVYTGEENRSLSFFGRDIAVVSANGPAACVIDVEPTYTAFRLEEGETAASRIEGFTLQIASGAGGISLGHTDPLIANCVLRAPPGEAGGVGIGVSGSSSRIEGCLFLGLGGPGTGGGLTGSNSDLVVVGCRFLSCLAQRGGAVNLVGTGSVLLTHCDLLGNRAMGDGGGVHVRGPSLAIDNCRIDGGSAQRGGAVFATTPNVGSGATCVVTSSTIAGNRAVTGGGLYAASNFTWTVANTILWDNGAQNGSQVALVADPNLPGSSVTVRWSDVMGGQAAVHVAGGTLTWGPGNLDADPLFADLDRRLSPNSPAIDAGSNPDLAPDRGDIDGDGDRQEPVPLDLDRQPRRADLPNVPDTGQGAAPIVDMGSYERQP